MSSPEKDRLAAEAMQCWADFQERLSSGKQKYPVQRLLTFARSILVEIENEGRPLDSAGESVEV